MILTRVVPIPFWTLPSPSTPSGTLLRTLVPHRVSVDRGDFEATLSAVGLARHFVADRLQRWQLPDLIDTAALLTSELVANAVVHAGRSGPVLSVAVAGGTLEIGVSDRGRPLARSDLAVLDEQTVMADGGRGMILVEALADEWGTISGSGGKQVWFRLETAADWSHRAECGCCASNIDRVRLESGRDVLATPGHWDDSVTSTGG